MAATDQTAAPAPPVAEEATPALPVFYPWIHSYLVNTMMEGLIELYNEKTSYIPTSRVPIVLTWFELRERMGEMAGIDPQIIITNPATFDLIRDLIGEGWICEPYVAKTDNVVKGISLRYEFPEQIKKKRRATSETKN